MSATKMTRKGKPGNPQNRRGKKSNLGKVGLFRWLKKSFAGKSHAESIDLLDQWILKKKMLSLFF